jgi:hypothetical protein
MNGKNSQTASTNDLAAALAQFNNGVSATRELDKQSKAVAKAEKRRDLAAQKLKESMDNDAGATDRTSLEEEYRVAVDDWTRLTNPNSDVTEIDGEEATETVDVETTPTEELSQDQARADEADG